MTNQESYRGAVHPKFPIPFLYVAVAFAQAAVTSGIIFGWPALQLVLTKVGSFESYCKPNQTMRPCPEQVTYFNTIYTCAIFANNISSFFTGAFLDKFGPKWTNFAGFVLFMCGCLPFIFQVEEIYVVGYALLGFSGPGVYLSIMHLSNLFPRNQSFVLSLFSGTFAVSSLVFKIFEVLYEPNSWFDVPHMFICLEIILAPLALLGLIVWPRLAYTPVFTPDETITLIGPQQGFGRKKSKLYNAKLRVQLKSGQFWIPAVWISLQALHIHSYIGSINAMFIDTVSYISAFNWIWLGGVVAIPIFGIMLDKRGTTFSFFFSTVLLLLFSICSLVPIMELQYLTFVLVSLTNVGIWGILYSYLFNVFGVRNYGKILGSTFFLIAAVGLLQYPILDVTIRYFHYNFTYANIFFAIVSIFLFIEPLFLWRVDKNKNRELKSVNSINSSVGSDTESATESLIEST